MLIYICIYIYMYVHVYLLCMHTIHVQSQNQNNHTVTVRVTKVLILAGRKDFLLGWFVPWNDQSFIEGDIFAHSQLMGVVFILYNILTSSSCRAVSSSVSTTEQRTELWPQLSGGHCATVVARGRMGSTSRSRIAFAHFYTHASANSTCCPAAHQGICGFTQLPHQHPWWCMHRLYPTPEIHLSGLCKYQVKDKYGYSSPVLMSSPPLIKISGGTHAPLVSVSCDAGDIQEIVFNEERVLQKSGLLSQTSYS